MNAAYLAKAGKKVLTLERRHVLGGAAVTEEIFPGFLFSECSYVVSLLRPEIIRELDLPRHGLEILPLDGTFTPMANGNHLWRMNDHARTQREIRRHSRVDAEAYDEFSKVMTPMCRFVKPLLSMIPPDPTTLKPGDLKQLHFLMQRFRSLSSDERYTLVQLMTMSAADFLGQWFETDVLKATMSASGIIGTFLELFAGYGLRFATSLHGRNRWRVSSGFQSRRYWSHFKRHCRRRPRSRRGNPHPGGRRENSSKTAGLVVSRYKAVKKSRPTSSLPASILISPSKNFLTRANSRPIFSKAFAAISSAVPPAK